MYLIIVRHFGHSTKPERRTGHNMRSKMFHLFRSYGHMNVVMTIQKKKKSCNFYFKSRQFGLVVTRIIGICNRYLFSNKSHNFFLTEGAPRLSYDKRHGYFTCFFIWVPVGKEEKIKTK